VEILLSFSSPISVQQAPRQIPEPRIFEGRIRIVMQHAKREIVKSAERPDRDDQQNHRFPIESHCQQHCGTDQSEQQEQHSFELEQPGIGDVHIIQRQTFLSFKAAIVEQI
jgi:hypothetical protein